MSLADQLEDELHQLRFPTLCWIYEMSVMEEGPNGGRAYMTVPLINFSKLTKDLSNSL